LVEDYNVIRSPPIWPQFEKLLEIEGEKAQSQECNRCRSTNHESTDCKRKYCPLCRDTGNKTSNQQRLFETIIETPATKNIPMENTPDQKLRIPNGSYG
jgi:ribosomal protein L37AE/L43A